MNDRRKYSALKAVSSTTLLKLSNMNLFKQRNGTNSQNALLGTLAQVKESEIFPPEYLDEPRIAESMQLLKAIMIKVMQLDPQKEG